jgi:hypothetical protein
MVRSIDLARHQHRAVEEERRPAVLDDVGPRPGERLAAGRGQLGRVVPGEAEPAPGPEPRMDQDRQAPAPEGPGDALHPGHVVEMPVAEHDRLDVPKREAQPAHVLHHAGRRDAGVEEQRVPASLFSTRTSAEKAP